jgi:hypothetical protein
MLRRDFIRLASMGAGSLPLLRSSSAFGNVFLPAKDSAEMNETSPSLEELLKLFQNPPNRYRPMVRWWWNGDRVTSEEVLRELDVMQKAGIGGVEINPIRFPSESDPMDTKVLTWMSDEWIEVLKTALQGTKERGMTCDMIVGSGWPYGGEFLAREDQTQMMALGTRDFEGPMHASVSTSELLADVHPRFVSPYKDPLKQLSSAVLVPYELDGLRSAVSVDASGETLTFDVPAGRHVLYFLIKLTGFMAVINGAPGASGPVLNHYSASSVEKYLNRISDRLITKVGPLSEHFRAFFTDSIELEGENWCDDMLAEFKRRRGYDLALYLPFVLFKVGEMGNAVSTPYGSKLSATFEKETQLVRYDFETTKHELFQERFVGTFVAWCTKVGVKSRMQAYGMDCDPITAGMMIDIPECETWIRSEEVEAFGNGDYSHGRNYTMINKFVSSAAHLSGKRLISCEEMTNTDDPFHTSMEHLKVAGDQSVLSGVTQSVLHGFNYSPLSAPFPGWVRYGTFFNERNTWWPYFKLWTDYKARLSMLFQHADMQADIAILPPSADLAAKYGFQRDPFPRLAYPEYLFKLWEAIHQNGSGCDYLNESVIGRSSVKGGRLVFQGRSYKAILLPEVESLLPATARQLQKFVAAGGTILFLEKTPNQSAGFEHHSEESVEVMMLIAAMRAEHPDRTPVVPVNEKDLVTWYRDLQHRYALTPDVVISHPTDYISQMRYRNGEQDIFFFTHYGPEEKLTFEATFQTGSKEAWLWDAETGARSRLLTGPKKNTFTISLGPSESKLIVFERRATAKAGSKKANTRSLEEPKLPMPQIVLIEGPWSVKLASVDGSMKSVELPNLIDLMKRKDLMPFAGTITYRATFETDGKVVPKWLSLGRVHAISEVEVNGESLGVGWYGEHRYDVRGKLHPGQNQILIKIVTTLGNYMKSLKDNRTAQAWTARTPDYPIGLVGPVEVFF